MGNGITDLTGIYPLVNDDLPGIDQYLLAQHVEQAMRRYCQDSEAYRQKIIMDLVVSQVAYVMAPVGDSRIHRVWSVHMLQDADVTYGRKGMEIHQGMYEFSKATKTLTLNYHLAPRAAVTHGLNVWLVMIPQITDATTTPIPISVDFLNDNAEGIAAYALYTLKKLPKQKWTDLNASARHLAEYRHYVCVAKCDVVQDNKQEPPGFRG